MLQTQYIKQFIFNKAEYLLDNGNGSKLLLKVDYKNNQFFIEKLSQIDENLLAESKKIAQDLLSRKHNVNFAKQG